MFIVSYRQRYGESGRGLPNARRRQSVSARRPRAVHDDEAFIRPTTVRGKHRRC